MAEHVGHDPVLVAAAADRGGRLADVLTACTDCVGLLRDLRALALATPGAAIPRRPRDLRLTIDDARRLRSRSWRRFVAGIAAGSAAMTRPVAMTFMTLGLVGLLLGSVPAALPLDGAASQAGASVDATQPLRTTEASGGVDVAGSPDQVPGAASMPTTSAASADGGLLHALSLILLGLGLTTFAVGRWASARESVR